MKKLLFIHIPKTAGTSLKVALSCNFVFDKKFIGHEPLFYIEKNVLDYLRTDTFIFSIVRNPYTRTFSYFKHFCRMTNTNFNFSEFLFLIKTKMSPLFNSDSQHNKTPFILFDQSFFLTNSLNVIDVDKIYKFENLLEIEKDYSITLPIENTGGYSVEEYINSYTLENINLVKSVYSNDFENFSYSKKFEDSIPKIL